MDNLRGSLLMILAMAGFATEDGFVKYLSKSLPVGQILILLGISGGLVFWAMLARKGRPLLSRDLLHPLVMLRNAGELIGTLGYVLAITLTPLSSASAIFQAMPLVVVLGAALFLGEKVGWHRWSAILVGLAGVALVMRPWNADFQLASLFALQGVFGLALRDLATRRMPAAIPSDQLSTIAFFIIAVMGALMMVVTGDHWHSITPHQYSLAAGSTVFAVLGYAALVAATRAGDVSVIAPFRYSRLVFGMAVGIIIFDERPDLMTYLGGAVIVSAGIYAFWRESRSKRGSKPA